MKIIIVSDLHLTFDDKVSNFTGESIFLSFLEKVKKSEIQEFILAGDIFELWQGGFFLTEEKRFYKTYDKYQKIFKTLQSMNCKVDYVYGNHDNYWNKVDKSISQYVFIHTLDYAIYISHGHEYDEIYQNKFYQRLGRMGTEFWSLIEKVLSVKTATEILKKQTYKFGKNLSDIDLEKFYKNVEKFIDDKAINIVICGHTHIPDIKSFKNSIILNSGNWCDGNTNYVYIDTDKNRFGIAEYNANSDLLV